MSTIVVLEQFGRVRRQINRLCILYLKELGIGPKQMLLLRYVHRKKQCSMTEVAAGVGSDKASVTRMVNALVKTHHLQRLPVPHDRRHSLVRLGPKSKALLPQIERIYKKVSDDFVGKLPSREQKKLLATLLSVQPRLQRAINVALADDARRKP